MRGDHADRVAVDPFVRWVPPGPAALLHFFSRCTGRRQPSPAILRAPRLRARRNRAGRQLAAAVGDGAAARQSTFVEELVAALRVGGLLRSGRHGLELVRYGEVPLPDTVRDAVLISASELSEEGRAAAEAAAVAGESFDLDLAGTLSSPAGVSELLVRGLAREQDLGIGAVRKLDKLCP